MSDKIQLGILNALARREPIDLPELLGELRKELPGLPVADLVHVLGELISELRVLPLVVESIRVIKPDEEIP